MSNLRPPFSLEELLAELGQGSTELEGYYTSAEWREKLGVGYGRIHQILKLAQRQGKLDAQQVMRPGIDGRMARTSVYAFRLEGEKKGI